MKALRKDAGEEMTIPIYRPYVFLRCKQCGRKTDHVLISIETPRKGEVEETYECQECGETKKIFELATQAQLQNQIDTQ